MYGEMRRTEKKTVVVDFNKIYFPIICLGGLEVACWPLVPKYAGSNPAEAV